MSWDHCFILFWLIPLVVSCRRVNLAHYSPWLEAEVSNFLLLVFLSFPNSSVKTIIAKLFFNRAFAKCQGFAYMIPLSSHNHVGFLNLISSWQLKSKAQIFAGLDPTQACQFYGCIYPVAPKFSMPCCRVPRRAAWATQSISGFLLLKEKLTLAAWLLRCPWPHTVGFVRHACVPGSHSATWHLSETGSGMASRQESSQRGDVSGQSPRPSDSKSRPPFWFRITMLEDSDSTYLLSCGSASGWLRKF